IDPRTGKDTVLRTVPMDDPKLNVADCDFTSDMSNVAYVTKRGSIFQSKGGAPFREVYSSARPAVKDTLSIPWQTAVDASYVYFSDVGIKKILRMKLSDSGKASFSFTGMIPDVIRNFKIYHGGFVAVTDIEIRSGDFNGNVISGKKDKRYSVSIIIERVLILLSAVLASICALLLLIWIYVYGFGRKLSEVTMQSLVIIGVVVISTVLILKIAIPTFTEIYKNNVFNNLKHLNQLSSKYIDGNLVRKISGRGDFMNADYVKLRTQLHGMFNNNNDEWNSDYYGGIYTVKGNDVHVLMFFDDSSGVNFPYKEDYMRTPFKDVIEQGSIVTIEESDIYGSWMYSLGPIYDKKGELAGILEIGRDQQSFNSKITDFVRRINKEILTVLVIFVLCMIEIAILRDVFKSKNRDRSSPFGKYSVDIVRMLAFIIAFAYALPVSYIPLMMRQILSDSGTTLFNLPEAVAIAIPISAEMLATAVFSVIAGHLTQKKGWKFPFLIGALCMAIGSFIAYYIHDPYAFIVARVFVGTSYGFALVTLQCFPMISPDVTVRNHGLASQNSGLNAGYCCGVAIGGLCADYFGFSGVYLVSVLVSLGAILYAVFLMNNARTHGHDGTSEVSVSDILRYFKDRNVFLFFFSAFIPISICGMFLAYMFPVYAEGKNISAGDISRVFMMNSLIIIYLGPVLVRFFSHRESLRGKWSMLVYSAVSLSGLVLFAISPSLVTAIVMVLLVGLGDSFGLPMTNDYLLGLKASSLIGYDNSVGYLNFIGNMGQMIGPVLMGYLFTMGYDKGTMVIIIGMALLMFIFIAGSRKNNSARARA
ncbi:MAG TPA: MFS transporter, partial [Spirochaetota bacterium]|nr:MFS transporter [Spirochaetota bacterium]